MPTKRRKRAQLGGPIVTLILAVAGIAIAAIVIAYMTGLIGGMKKPIIDESSVYIYQSGDTWKIEFTMKNPTGKAVDITKVTIFDDDGAEITSQQITTSVGNDNRVNGNTDEEVTVTLTQGNFGKKDAYKVIIYTSAGKYVVTAIIP